MNVFITEAEAAALTARSEARRLEDIAYTARLDAEDAAYAAELAAAR